MPKECPKVRRLGIILDSVIACDERARMRQHDDDARFDVMIKEEHVTKRDKKC
jgi:hypothetical protein